MIETEEYARMKSGEILKITGTCYEIDDYKIYKTDRNYTIVEDEIKSHSKKISDILEVGDFVNGEKVVEILVGTSGDGSKLILIRLPRDIITYEEIKEILTHEQYKQNCYRVKKD